jgi:membrane fusion protein (multidrug efflux system)
MDNTDNLENDATQRESNVPSKRSKPSPLVLIITILLLLGVSAWGFNYWRYVSTHVSTDDAFLSNDLVYISPQVSGSVKKVLIEDNQEVKAGEVLVQLDDAPYQAAVEQAQANLEAAIAQAEGAGVSVDLVAATGDAAIEQASGVVAQSVSGIEGAKADVSRSTAGIAGAQANELSAKANVLSAQAMVKNAIVNRKRAVDAYTSIKAVVSATKSGVKAAQAAISASEAANEKAEADAARAESLFAQEVISRQAIDQARAALKSTRAQVESARQQKAVAESAVVQREAECEAAHSQIEQADVAITQAKAQLSAAQQLAEASKAGVSSALALRIASQQSVIAAEGKKMQALGQLKQANTAPRQVSASKTNQKQALAKISQARAALRSAQIQLGYTRVVAPTDGIVSKKSVEVGSLVQPGSQLMAFVPSKQVWVVANFKETQLAKVDIGQKAEIDVDGLPGMTFTGHVDSFSAATGSTFALLPPDNATGNFTKVVQRIPIKLVLDKGQKGLERLRPGMSVKAIIVTRS